jgi:hypothetical protein
VTLGAALMSSAAGDWRTPEIVLEHVRQVGAIGLDPCGRQDSIVGAKVEWRLTVDGDSLLRPVTDWFGKGLVYCNPPYGRGVDAWLSRCAMVAGAEGEAIALIPARTDTRWWRLFCVPGEAADAVCFWHGRLTFLGAPAAAPFPSAIVYWGTRSHRFADVFQSVGSIWT